jgi:hypothetical protein
MATTVVALRGEDNGLVWPLALARGKDDVTIGTNTLWLFMSGRKR